MANENNRSPCVKKLQNLITVTKQSDEMCHEQRRASMFDKGGAGDIYFQYSSILNVARISKQCSKIVRMRTLIEVDENSSESDKRLAGDSSGFARVVNSPKSTKRNVTSLKYSGGE